MIDLESRTDQIEDSGRFIAGVFSALRRQRRIALFTFLGLAALATFLVALLPREYSAEMKILVKNDRPSEVITPGVSSPQTQTDVDETQINSEIELMTNNGLLKRVVEETTAQPQAGGLPISSGVSSGVMEKQVKSLQKHLHVEATRKSDIVEVTYADRNPERAEFVLNRVLADYLEAHTKAHASPGTYAFFKGQAGDLAARLAQVDARMETLETQQGALNLPQEEDVLVKGREDAQAALLSSAVNIAAEQNSLSQGQTIYKAAAPSLETESRSMPNQYSIERMRTLLVELRNKRSDLLTNFPPTDRQVLDLDRQIGITQESLQTAGREENVERVTGINPARQSLESEMNHLSMSLAAERAKRSSLGQQVGLYDRRLASLASLKLQHAELERQHKELEDSYLLYARKEEEARAAEALDAQRFSNISVIEAPLAFHVASQPKVPLDLLLGWSLALCLALSAALLTDRYWARVQDADTLEEITGLPVLGMPMAVRSW